MKSGLTDLTHLFGKLQVRGKGREREEQEVCTGKRDALQTGAQWGAQSEDEESLCRQDGPCGRAPALRRLVPCSITHPARGAWWSCYTAACRPLLTAVSPTPLSLMAHPTP